MGLIPVIREFMRSLGAFLVVGIIATIVHYIALTFFINSGIISSLALANIAAFLCGLSFSYIGNSIFVFEKKRSHVAAFGYLLMGYIAALAVNTGLLVGLAEGSILKTLAGPLANFGGNIVLDFWHWLISFMPFLAGDNAYTVSTTAAFIVATGTSASMTYAWNRWVVFQPRVRIATKPTATP